MTAYGIARKPGTCAICTKGFSKGAHVYHDPHKSETNSLVHKNCWDELRASRGTPLLKKTKGRQKLSSVELDAPF